MNPDTYQWTQADPEDYDSNASPKEQADAILAQARKGEVVIGRAAISYDKSSRRYSVLLPGKSPQSYSVRQAREFLTTTL